MIDWSTDWFTTTVDKFQIFLELNFEQSYDVVRSYITTALENQIHWSPSAYLIADIWNTLILKKDVQCTHVISLRRLHSTGLMQYIWDNFYHINLNSSKWFVTLQTILFSMGDLGWNGHTLTTWTAQFVLQFFQELFSFLLGFTFLLVALSTGAALVYSGCAGSFSTNNLTEHHNITLIKQTDYHVANHVFMFSMLYLRDEFWI